MKKFRGLYWFLGGAFSIIVAVTSWFTFTGYSIGIDGIVGMTTAALACATFWLALEEARQGALNRKLSRIREQLRDLYSPLYGIGEDIFTNLHKHKMIVFEFMVKEIQKSYKYLASPNLKCLLDDYYKCLEENLPELLPKIWKQIEADYERLSRDYTLLTGEEILKNPHKPYNPHLHRLQGVEAVSS